MSKLLIVSPRFPPTNAPEIHRVRLSLEHYRAFGWEPTVLAIEPATADGVEDEELGRSIPSDIRVVRVRAWDERTCRRFGFGQLAYRSLWPLYRAGCRLLRGEHYDVVLFSTTVFLTFALGPLWKRRFGCAVVYDFHDPWYAGRPKLPVDAMPGSQWKYRLDLALAAPLERCAITAADHVITVSDGYVAALSRTYRRLAPEMFTVLPFAAATSDHQFTRSTPREPGVFDHDPRLMHWFYVGAISAAMMPVLGAFFAALAQRKATDPGFASTLRLHFVGTDYAPPQRARKRAEPLAAAHGIADIVDETPERAPYFKAISLYHAADAILVIGAADADYTASKLLNCILAKKPVLALFNRRSMGARLARQFDNVFLAEFSQTPADPEFPAQIAAGIDWVQAAGFDPDVVERQAQPWSAEALTRVQCAIFDRIAAPAPKPEIVGRQLRRAWR